MSMGVPLFIFSGSFCIFLEFEKFIKEWFEFFLVFRSRLYGQLFGKGAGCFVSWVVSLPVYSPHCLFVSILYLEWLKSITG